MKLLVRIDERGRVAAGTMAWMDDVDALPESELLAAARRGDQAAFERMVSTHRRELFAHCYRMPRCSTCRAPSARC